MENFIHAYSWINIRFLLQGLWVTIYVSLISIALSFILGLVCGFIRYVKIKYLSTIVGFVIDIIRNLPLLLIIFFITAVDPGQMEGARSNGMTYMQAMYHVIIPQALNKMIPSLLSQFVSLVKDTSLATIIVLPELLFHAQIIYSQNTTYLIPMYVIIAIMYFIVCFSLSMIAKHLQSKY